MELLKDEEGATNNDKDGTEDASNSGGEETMNLLASSAVLRLIEGLDIEDEVQEDDISEKMESILGTRCLFDYNIYEGNKYLIRIQFLK